MAVAVRAAGRHQMEPLRSGERSGRCVFARFDRGTQCRFDALSAAYCGIGLVGIAFVACKMLQCR